ncbi:Flp pilus assembly complex ATPase component TadA [Candidatus Micrarchaeota archaeon]|nr:Flp pilus assembly complex ATPase component TadA [Candidatus Micrarchaeota archaeon]
MSSRDLVIVPDTGALIDGRITQKLVKLEAQHPKVLVHNSVIAELEYQANLGKEIGFAGLDELRQLASLAAQGVINLEFVGDRPSSSEIERAKFGEIDAKIRYLALQQNGQLITTDKVQAQVASAQGINVLYLEPVVSKLEFSLANYFSSNTLSVHLKEGITPRAKQGKPGEFKLAEIGRDPVTRKQLEKIAQECVEFSKRAANSFIEIDRKGLTVIQAAEYRVTYTRPPLSDTAELTAVRPIVKLSLRDYNLSRNVYELLTSRAEGVLIAGSPGSGKSTLATAVADHYAAQSKIVKTVESPRDLQVGKDVTQYALGDDVDLINDVLLLVRPDYTVYDEVRKQRDFLSFADLRLAGIGMIGVVHASKPIDAVQRFIGKVELGMIPQIIDTIVFVSCGRVSKVYVLKYSVKVPTGMREKDLSRPVIEVRDFETSNLEYEIYTFGEETVVYPVHQEQNKFERRKHWKRR